MNNTPFNVMRHNDWDRAPRGPITLFSYAVSTLGFSTAGAVLFSVGATLAISAVTSWALSALAPKPPSGVGTQGLLTNARDPAAPHEYVYGEVRKGGVVTYLESTGENNKFLHQIIVLAGHELESIGDIYINDEVVTLNSSGFVTSGPWSGQSGSITTKIRIQKFDGSQITPPADLINESVILNESRDGNPPAAANFIGRGIAYLYVRMEYDQDVFANGIPLFTAKVKGKKVEDPRTSTTAYSANAALCIRDYLVTDYGLADVGSTDETVFSVAANVCDETVSKVGGGTEKRYEMNGVISSSLATGDILQSMMTSCAGTLFWGQGKWQLRAGYYTAPVKTFTLDDLRGPISLSTRTSRRDNFNIVRGKFNDAEQRYITSDYPERRSDAFITEDNGLENALDLELPLTTSSAMAQRLAKLTLFRGREQMAFNADFSMEAFNVQVGDIIALTNPRYGWTDKEFEVLGWRFSADGDAGDLRVNLSLRETSEAAFDWDAEEEAIITNNTNLPVFNAGLTILGLTASGGGRTQGDGTFINSAILSWTAAANSFVDYYDVEWKPVADSDYASTTTSENSLEISPLIDGVEYAFRVRAVTVAGVRGDFASVTFTGGGDDTAPADPTSLSAVGVLGFIDLSWVNPADRDFNYAEIWESESSTFGAATEIATAFGTTFNRGNLAPLTQRYYWIRAVDFSGNKSGFVGPVNATTRQIEVGDIGPAVIEYDNFASDVTTIFDGLRADVDDRVLISDYNITVDLQQQLEDATTQLATDTLTLALNASALESRVNDAGITVDPTTGSVTIQGLSAVEDRVNTVEIDLDAVEGELTLKASTTYVNDAIAAATLPEATLAALDDLEARVDTVEIDLNAVEGAITLSSTGSLYNVNDGVLGVEALRSDITIAQGEIALKAAQTELDDVETRLSSAEISLNTLDAPTITLAVSDVRRISDKQDDLADLTLKEVIGRYNDRKYVTQDVAFARQELVADVNDQREAFASLTTELAAQIDDNEASILSEQLARATADSALASDITQLQSTVVDLDNDIAGNATAISSLDTRVTSAEGTITSQATAITSLQSDLSTVDGETSANATAISSLDTRVTNAEGEITAQATEINTLSSSLTSAEGDIAGNATAISGLNTRVTDNEGDISAQASQINSLSTTVGNNTTTINQVATSVNGIEGKYGVTIDNNSNITGFQLLSGAGGSAFNVRADQFAVFNSTGAGGDNPFTIFTSSRTIGGVVYPAGTYIRDAFIDNAAIVDGSITNAKIGNTIQSTNYVSGSTGWRILKDGSAEFNGPVISRQLLVDSGQVSFPNASITRRTTIGETFEHYVESTNTPISAWAGAKKTYLCNVEVTANINANVSDVPDIYWGFTGEILPLTRWSGNQTLRLRLVFWTKKVIGYSNLNANWKIYEVT